MKQNQPFAWLAAVIFSASLVTGASAEQTATIKENFVNVRGQPNLIGEVITQLKKGETVVVLEEITVEKPKPGDPPKWARIKMPDNTPVWVSAAFIDPAQKTVTASRLNLRAGPGENYSVVGRLERGEQVKEIRTVDGWMEIETPPSAYAFVAAEYLATKSDGAVLATAATPAPASETAAASAEIGAAKKTDLVEPVAPKEETATPATAPPAVTTVTPPDTSVTTPATNAPATTTANATTEALPAVAPPPAVAQKESEPLPKRIVRREGIVRSALNIQAPTYFELVSPETRKTINYLHTEDSALKLKDFKGKKIVVTGEEGIDPRWPNTPVIEIETLEAAP